MESAMFVSRRLVPILPLQLLLLLVTAGWAAAAPLTTKYYSLDLPPDWVVVSGPETRNGAVQVLLGQKEHKASAAIVVGPSQPGDAEKAAQAGAQRMGGSTPVAREGQLQFHFEQKGVTGYSVVREDPQAKLLLVLMVSGDTKLADFIYRMRGPNKGLLPRQP